MGDEFNADGPVQLKVLVHGTGPIARVDIIKDFVYVYSTEPKTAAGRVRVDRRREARPAGLSWYYVRAIQDDGELAWGSPIWVHLGSRRRSAGLAATSGGGPVWPVTPRDRRSRLQHPARSSTSAGLTKW